MPDEREISAMYSNYYDRNDGIGYSGYPLRLAASGLDYLLWDIMKQHAESASSLLDVGCAYGARVDFFRRRGVRVSGVDISTEAVTYGRQKWGLDLSSGKFEDFDEGGVFDVITMIDFVEHLPVPDDWMHKTTLLTHPGSLVLILTPDFDCYDDYGEKWIGYNTSYEHVLFYNRKALSEVLHRRGFEVVAAMNVISMPPVVTASIERRATADSIREVANLMQPVLIIDWLRQIRMDLMAKLTWRKLILNDPRQNSLLVAAKRTALGGSSALHSGQS